MVLHFKRRILPFIENSVELKLKHSLDKGDQGNFFFLTLINPKVSSESVSNEEDGCTISCVNIIAKYN